MANPGLKSWKRKDPFPVQKVDTGSVKVKAADAQG
jgi:hypothetical protein